VTTHKDRLTLWALEEIAAEAHTKGSLADALMRTMDKGGPREAMTTEAAILRTVVQRLLGRGLVERHRYRGPRGLALYYRLTESGRAIVDAVVADRARRDLGLFMATVE
jgi:hypothetical protein